MCLRCQPLYYSIHYTPWVVDNSILELKGSLCLFHLGSASSTWDVEMDGGEHECDVNTGGGEHHLNWYTSW